MIIQFAPGAFLPSGKELEYLGVFQVFGVSGLTCSSSTSYILVLFLFPFALLRLKSPSAVFEGVKQGLQRAGQGLSLKSS